MSRAGASPVRTARVVGAPAASRVRMAAAPSVQPVELLTRLRRARDFMDRAYADALDVATVADRAMMSPAHFSREFKKAYGETPHAYLMTRRVERATVLLRSGSTVTEACMAVGAASLGSFSSSFTRLVGETPSAYRARSHDDVEELPACLAQILGRPVPMR